MDPYQGLQFGVDRQNETHVADDLGIGLPGLGVLVAADLLADRGGYLPWVGAGDVGAGGGKRLMRSAMRRAKPPGMTAQTFERLTDIFPRGGQGFQGPKTTQYLNMKSDIAGLKGGMKISPMAGLYQKSHGNLQKLRTRYGSSAGRRIWGVTKIGKFARTVNVVSLLTLGIELGGGIYNAINDYEPSKSILGGMTPEFGGYETPFSRTAWTQRQASLQAIHQSGMQARAALGNEAALLH